MIWIILLLIIVILLLAPLCADMSYGKVFERESTEKKKKRKEQKNQDKEERSDSAKKKKKTSFKSIKEILNFALDIFGFLKKRLEIEILKLHFHIGFDDAAETGIVTGSAWGFLYDFVSICDKRFKLKKHSVHVSPDFTQEVFETDINIRVSLRLIYAITVAIKILKGMKKL